GRLRGASRRGGCRMYGAARARWFGGRWLVGTGGDVAHPPRGDTERRAQTQVPRTRRRFSTLLIRRRRCAPARKPRSRRAGSAVGRVAAATRRLLRLAQSDAERELAPLLRVVGRHHRIVGLQPELLTILVRRQFVLDGEVPLQQLLLL